MQNEWKRTMVSRQKTRSNADTAWELAEPEKFKLGASCGRFLQG